MKSFKLFGALLSAFAVASAAQAADPKQVLGELDTRLSGIGAPRIEGTAKLGDAELPVLFFGPRRMNGNYDVVDEIKKKHGATATIFVRSGEEFVRISTNVLTPEGKRGVGTNLARAKAYEAVIKGQGYCGDVDVLGTAFSACYNPIKDAKGQVVAVTYIGFKK
ncbi:MAG: Cache 3/Cache 2 fusion domain-containing protein [Paucibacter sp.]|nr:Cache 3/Cache 2 fusion domain-containing protein [Roseateles sp.]